MYLKGTYIYCFDYGNALSGLEGGKKLQIVLDRAAKFTFVVTWIGSGFRRVGRTLLPKIGRFCRAKRDEKGRAHWMLIFLESVEFQELV